MVKIREHEQRLSEIKLKAQIAEALDLYTIESKINGIGQEAPEGKRKCVNS